jgi:RNA polymerase sigma-70 factor (ECF subfamily)
VANPPAPSATRPAPAASDDDDARATADARLLGDLRRGDPRAREALVDRFAPLVRRMLVRVLGASDELEDVAHEAFLRILASVARVRDPRQLTVWVTRVTVFTARDHLRRKRRTRWLWFLPHDELPDPSAAPRDADGAEAVRAAYAVLANLAVDDRVAFALRAFAGLRWEEVAAGCGISLATAKRRVGRAEARFLELAREHPALRAWIDDEPARGKA